MAKECVRLSLIAILLSCLFNVYASDNTIKIGVAGPHSGSNAAFGEQLWRGATLAAKGINEKGGINGKQIELIKADDACEPKQAVSVANRLVEFEHVHAVVGHFCSSSTIPASEVYADAGTLMITPASTNPAVTDRGLTTIFRTCGRDDQQGMIAAEFIHHKLKAKRVAVIHDKDTYGQGLADAMKAHLESLGNKPVLYEGLTRGEKDFNALVTKIKQVQADAVYFGGMHPEAGPLLRQLREHGSEIPFISGDGIMSQDFVHSAGGPQIVRHTYMTFGRDPRKLPAGQSVVKEFRAQGFEPEGYTLYAYATVQVIADALKDAKVDKGDSLAAWLHQHSVDTVMGAKAWNQKGDLKQTDFVIYAWQSDGSYTEVTEQ